MPKVLSTPIMQPASRTPPMQARKVLMVANGVGKADIIKKAFFGPVTPEVPASILQMHPDFTLVLDAEAASKLD